MKQFRTLSKIIGEEEVRQYAMLFLCEAASGYDENKGAVSTWVGCHLRMRFIEICRDYKVTKERMPITRGYDEEKDGAVEYPTTDDAMDAGIESVKLIAVLNDRSQEIIRLRYGIGGRQRMTLEQVGEKFRLSKERVRQIEEMAIKAMRAQQWTGAGIRA